MFCEYVHMFVLENKPYPTIISSVEFLVFCFSKFCGSEIMSSAIDDE